MLTIMEAPKYFMLICK